MFPTERRLIKKINSGAVSEKLCVQCTKSFTVKEDAEGWELEHADMAE